MANSQYNWKSVRSKSVTKTRGDDHLTRWVIIAVVLAVVSHAAVLFAMNKMPVYFGGNEALEELATDQVVVRSVEDRTYLEEFKDEDIVEPPADASDILTELELLEQTPDDLEIDFSPTIDEPEMSVDMEMPPIKGDLLSSAEDFTVGADLNDDFEDLGSTEEFIKPEKGQITIDAGIQNADSFDPDAFSKELAKGAGGTSEDGVIDGFTPLAEMTKLSKSDLNNAKGMIGSDLLYEFGKATLRDSAKNSLMKVVLLIDKNPEMYCWIEGHTDLIGSDEANELLSIERAQAVKTWLVETMRISPDKLYVRGFGEKGAIVVDGDQSAQAINRRVEIKMRKNAPPKEIEVIKSETPAVKEPRLIKPKRNPNLPSNSPDAGDTLPPPPAGVAIPVPEVVPENIPRAQAVPNEGPQPQKAVIVSPEESKKPLAPKAVPIEENTQKPDTGASSERPPKALLVDPSQTSEPQTGKAIPVE